MEKFLVSIKFFLPSYLFVYQKKKEQNFRKVKMFIRIVRNYIFKRTFFSLEIYFIMVSLNVSFKQFQRDAQFSETIAF